MIFTLIPVQVFVTALNNHLHFVAKYHNPKTGCVFNKEEGVKLELTLTLNITAMTPAPISARMIHPTSTEY